MNEPLATKPRQQFGRAGTVEKDKRQHRRLKYELPGRYVGADGVERRCVTSDISPVGLTLRTPDAPTLGEPIVAYIDELGRIEGIVVRWTEEGFALALTGTRRKAEKLAEIVEWLGRKAREHAGERRNAMRALGAGEAILTGRDGGGQQVIQIVDSSPTGVAFRAQGIAVGERIVIDGRKAVVLRVFNGGAAASFI